MMTATRYLAAAQVSALLIDKILENAGLDPRSIRYFLTETEQGDAWLFALFTSSERQAVENCLSPEVIIQLKVALKGHPMTLCRRYDLRLAVLLSSTLPV